MKLTKLSTFLMLVTAIALVSCKGKSNKELLMKKWVVMEMSGEGASKLPDSVKAQIYGKAMIEFKKDGVFETSGTGEAVKAGTYKISDDGKLLTTTETETGNTETINIEEISNDKVVFNDKKGNMKMTMKSK